MFSSSFPLLSSTHYHVNNPFLFHFLSLCYCFPLVHFHYPFMLSSLPQFSFTFHTIRTSFPLSLALNEYLASLLFLSFVLISHTLLPYFLFTPSPSSLSPLAFTPLSFPLHHLPLPSIGSPPPLTAISHTRQVTAVSCSNSVTGPDLRPM